MVAPMSGDPARTSRPLRADAARNRIRILDAATAAFAARGLDASLEQIARDAGVAIGTLYRHFPRREDLVRATFEAKLDTFRRLAAEAMAAEDPWHGFCIFLEQVCALQAEDAGMCDVLAANAPASQDLSDALGNVDAVVADLLAHAKRAGVLRPDFTIEDFRYVLIANGGVVQATRDTDPNAWRRHLSLLLDAARV
jgi:AcrR family transcriptional regulator